MDTQNPQTPEERAIAREATRIEERDRRNRECNPDTAAVVRITSPTDLQASVEFSDAARHVVSGSFDSPNYQPVRSRIKASTIVGPFHMVVTSYGISVEEEKADGSRVPLRGDLESVMSLVITRLEEITREDQAERVRK